jgi:HAD superfamily hydrolase (TIGR01509 family)
MDRTIAYVLFDLDGTLVDTERQAAEAVVEAYKAWGIRVSADDAGAVAGRKWETAFELLSARYPAPVEPKKAIEDMKTRYRRILRSRGFDAVPGGAEAVRSLAKDFALGLVSGSDRQDVLDALDFLKIRAHFQVILGAEDYPFSKPHPAGFLKAMVMLGQDPTGGLVFEDSEAGIESAHAAGMTVVAVTSTNHFSHNLGNVAAQVPDLRGVNPAWVRSLKLD